EVAAWRGWTGVSSTVVRLTGTVAGRAEPVAANSLDGRAAGKDVFRRGCSSQAGSVGTSASTWPENTLSFSTGLPRSITATVGVAVRTTECEAPAAPGRAPPRADALRRAMDILGAGLRRNSERPANSAPGLSTRTTAACERCCPAAAVAATAQLHRPGRRT